MDFPTNDHKLSDKRTIGLFVQLHLFISKLWISNLAVEIIIWWEMVQLFDLLRWSHVFINNVLSDWPVFLIDCKFSENLITKVEIGNQERGKKLLRKTNYEGGIIEWS
jgi:hypothetical protein